MDSANKVSDDEQSIVTIIIGKDDKKKTYLVHKGFACHHSPVLDRAFNSCFIEEQTQVYTIDDFEYTEAFAVIQTWMYSESLGSYSTTSHLELLYATWILSDRLLIPRLQNVLMKCIVSRKTPIDAQILGMAAWMYANTSIDSKLRLAYLERIAFRMTSLDMETRAKRGEILFRLMFDVAMVYKRNALACRRGHSCNLEGTSFGNILQWEDYKVTEC